MKQVTHEQLKSIFGELLTKYDINILPIKGNKVICKGSSADLAVDFVKRNDNSVVRVTLNNERYEKDGSGYIGYLVVAGGGVAVADGKGNLLA